MTGTTQPGSFLLNGEDLRRMFEEGRSCLEINASVINALNVFPVPDGDTGTNMLLTLRAVEEELSHLVSPGAGSVAQAMAHGSLMGARGNSGVILCQFFRGWAEALDGMDTFGTTALADAFTRASDAAYRSVSDPKEGTILTVIKEAARVVREAVSGGDLPLVDVWDQACGAARRALAETPDLLPVLKEAGVVDAGGMGLVAFMEGMRCYLRGEQPAILDIAADVVVPTQTYLASTVEDEYGYCTQLLLQGIDMDVDAVREHLAGVSTSTIVVGDSTTIKVHIHTEDPGAALSYATSLGSISQVSIDNMDEQHQGFLDMHRGRSQAVGAPSVLLGVVAVAAGQGIVQIFQQLGAVGIVPGGQTMNPSTKDILDCVAQAAASELIVLPNNSNIVSTAQQTASVSDKPIHVLPTTSIPQGIAALLVFNPDLDAEANLSQMQSAIAGVRAGEVTRAVRATTMNGQQVREGEAIALLDGRLIASCDSAPEAVLELCRSASPGAGALITLYWGEDTGQDEAERVANMLRDCYPGIDVEPVQGGQPHYDYLVSIE